MKNRTWKGKSTLSELLLKENYNSSHKAEKLFEAVIKAREKLQNKKLRVKNIILLKRLKKLYVKIFFKHEFLTIKYCFNL